MVSIIKLQKSIRCEIIFSQKSRGKESITSKLKIVLFEVEFSNTENKNTLKSDARTKDISIFITTHIDTKELDRFPRLKISVTCSTWFDHIDLTEITKQWITVSTAPFHSVNTVL